MTSDDRMNECVRQQRKQKLRRHTQKLRFETPVLVGNRYPQTCIRRHGQR